MSRLGILLILIYSQLIISCDDKSITPDLLKMTVETKVIYFNSIKTHELIIYGHKINEKIFPEKICVRRVGESKEVKYESIDQASLESSSYDFTYAWSPKGNHLVLPRGRFEGFTVFSIKQLPNSVAKGDGKPSVAVRGIVGSKWWHEFIGWKNDNTILFRAGLSYKSFMFEWNIENGDLLSLELKEKEFAITN